MADRFPLRSLLPAPPLDKGNEDSGNEIASCLIDSRSMRRLRAAGSTVITAIVSEIIKHNGSSDAGQIFPASKVKGHLKKKITF